MSLAPGISGIERDEGLTAVTQTAPPLPLSEDEVAAPRRSRRRWRDKFREAFRGLKVGVRGHSSFSVHFFFAALVLTAAGVFRCEKVEWCLLLGCIGMVLVAELFNSAIETLFRGLDEATRDRSWPALDVAAGAVLLASITAIIIGSIIFLPKLFGGN
jgi:diacylglycerol kinase